MAGRRNKKNRILAIWMILSMLFICAFSCTNTAEIDNQKASSETQEAFFAAPRAFSIQEATLCRMGGKELLGSKGEQQAFGRLKTGRVQNDLFLLNFFAVMLLYELSAFAQSFLVRSDATPRYSMISYIHRSHGKNPRC